MTTIVLWVADLNNSAKFYSELFQVDDFYITEGFASVSNSHNEVLLHEVPEQYKSDVSIGEDNPIKPVFLKLDIDHARIVATKHNCWVSDQVIEHNGKQFLDLKDVDGHVIQVAN